MLRLDPSHGGTPAIPTREKKEKKQRTPPSGGAPTLDQTRQRGLCPDSAYGIMGVRLSPPIVPPVDRTHPPVGGRTKE